ncbi:hypothetical protein Pla108_08380 [Botrimarina colliarenosi]|uniref:DUF2513 domain-containing protein n=1 Tax=Botrimarina colliarenosi TaxID=2528001 RepID=A0A5C6AL38_9BACT|nr:DUF2513 domain-containing protein [Botrimarina colliarenosi]TWT99895.1 hypothetical protein Pla108_08380 [Botrimarina colliarenosi]
MKRDLDLCRQLLADIEGHGPDCAVTALRPGASGEAEETLRYHVRLLIDAGLAKEVERPSAGVPCVRLTNAGHELLELAHSEARWREAKWVVGERTGTQSLSVIRSVLARWAYEAAIHGESWRPRRVARGYRPQAAYRPAYHQVEPRYRFERDVEPVIEPRPVTTTARTPYSYLERFDWRTPFDWRDGVERDSYYHDGLYREPITREGRYREGAYRNGYYRDAETLDLDGVTLPTYVV